jgi:hypothetical protein
MKAVPRTPAEQTVLLLQRAARGGSPVLIPGAWESRALPSSARVPSGADRQTTSAAQPSVVFDRERIERELEGGGAQSQRPRGRRAGLLTRLWRSALHPMEIGIIWSRVLSQSR